MRTHNRTLKIDRAIDARADGLSFAIGLRDEAGLI
jgi:hypothetical protein